MNQIYIKNDPGKGGKVRRSAAPLKVKLWKQATVVRYDVFTTTIVLV